MSVTWLILLVSLFGIVMYLLLQRFVSTARWVVTVLLMGFLVGSVEIVQNHGAIAYQWSSFNASWSSLFAKHRLNGSSSADRGAAPHSDVQSVSESDHNFLNQILEIPSHEGQNQGIAKGATGADNQVALVINTTEVRRAELVIAKETVKRAQLVPRNESFKRAEMGRSRQQ